MDQQPCWPPRDDRLWHRRGAIDGKSFEPRRRVNGVGIGAEDRHIDQRHSRRHIVINGVGMVQIDMSPVTPFK
jgi:hypothetical protein